MALLELRNLSRRFGNLAAVDDVSLSIESGEFVTLLGPSGCGKTTILRMIAGFELPDTGEIRLDGRNIADTPPEKRPLHTVFQSYALFPHMTVAENIAFPLRMARQSSVSDYPLGTQPDRANFPPRNRIISGLTKGVVVVEADERSGALITASFAAEQGRDVFAVPGSIRLPMCRGTNKLIQQGAKVVLSATDILEELNLAMVTEHQQVRTALPADETEKRVLACLSGEPVHVDDLGVQLSLPIAQVSSALALMELKGMVRQGGWHELCGGQRNAPGL